MGFDRILLNTESFVAVSLSEPVPTWLAVSRDLHEHVALKPVPSAASPNIDRLSLALQNRSRTWLASHPHPAPNPWLRGQPISNPVPTHPPLHSHFSNQANGCTFGFLVVWSLGTDQGYFQRTGDST